MNKYRNNFNTNKVNFTFMAWGSGNKTAEETAFKRYIGVAPVTVLDVNPNKAAMEKIYNTTFENEPAYVSMIETGSDNHKVANARIDFIIKFDAEKTGITDYITKVTFFLRNEPRVNKDGSKVQVIDKYGRTAWVTKEQYSTKEIPVYSNGPANIDKDYRACFFGEEELTNFIKTYLNIPSVMKYVNGKWVMVDNPSESESRLDHIEDYFKGDFSELKNLIALQPTNKIKVLFGVRNSNDRQYQTAYTQMFLKPNVKDYSKLEKDVQDRKNAGSYSTTEFYIGDIKEYTVEATNFSSSAGNSDMPFAPTGESSSPWDFGK